MKIFFYDLETTGTDVDKSKLHDAIYDAELCFSIFEKIK